MQKLRSEIYKMILSERELRSGFYGTRIPNEIFRNEIFEVKFTTWEPTEITVPGSPVHPARGYKRRGDGFPVWPRQKKPHSSLTQVWTTTIKLCYLTWISNLWPTHITKLSLHLTERYDIIPTDHISIKLNQSWNLLIDKIIPRIRLRPGSIFFHFLFALCN